MYSFFSIDFFLLLGAAAAAFVIGKNFSEIVRLITTNSKTLEQSILDVAPAIIWIEKDANIIWSNRAFDTMVKRLDRLVLAKDFNVRAKTLNTGKSTRAELQSPNPNRLLHFDLTKFDLPSGSLYVGISAKDTVTAEKERARFVQTLSEAFGHLPIGMAIFDRDRDLSMFNPALAEVLGVNTLWLTQRPSLRDFLDRLHNKGAMPEPRDFNSWRDQILDMETSAESGTYNEDWHLPNNNVLRVTGRPHPAGAVAFMFEDITHTMATELKYRIELDRLYAVMDTLTSGIIVFDPSGTVSFANDVFDKFWGTDFSNALPPTSTLAVSKIFADLCQPSNLLGEIRDFISVQEERGSWKGKLAMKDGRILDVHAVPLSAGYSMIEFQHRHGELQAPIKDEKSG